jgi:cell division protein FtsW (lipid II flippase)
VTADLADLGATGVIQRPAGRVRTMRPRMRLRNLELLLVLFALLLGAGAIALVQLGVDGRIDPQILTLAAVPAVLVLALHVVLRFVARDADPFVLPIATALNGLGIAEIYRVDLFHGGGADWQYGQRQVVWTAVSLAVATLVLLLLRNHRVLQRYTYIAMFVSIVLLLLPLVPGVGETISGARAWIHVGPYSFQPGELAKITLAVFFAGYLAGRRDSLSMVGRRVLGLRLPRLRDLGPILIIWALSMVVIIFEHDLGTGLLFFGMFVGMLYIATGRVSWVVIGVLLAAIGAIGASRVLSYVNNRVANWLDAFSPTVYSRNGGSYQLVQAIFGLANGGLFGTGLGQGSPGLVPEANSDFIISSLGEELGTVGLFAILAMYLLFVSRGFRIGFAGPDDFGKLLGSGLVFVFALQCFIVMGGVLRVIPETGLTTPFLAAGGSSLVANWVIAALLLRLSATIRSQPRLVI